MDEHGEYLHDHSRLCAQAQRMAHLGIWHWNVAKNQVEWSDELYRIYGLSRDTFGASFEAYLSLVYPEDRERVRATVEGVRRTGRPESFAERIVRPNGEIRHLRSWAAVQKGDDDSVSSLYGACIDVTELFQAHGELAQFVELVEHATDFIGIAELDGRIRYLNEAGRLMVGVDATEVGSKRVGDLLTPEGLKHSLDVELPAVLRDGHWSGDVQLVHQKTGARIETMATSFLLRDAATNEPRWVATVQRDVTARRALEQRLQHAQRMEALGRLASGVAHDFNNLLTVILALSSVASKDPALGEATRQELAEIDLAAQRGASLTRQLLALSRQQARIPRVLALDDVVRDSAKLLGRLLPDNFELHLSLAADGARVRADVSQLEQVLLNLVVNARDAMPTGGRIEIDTKANDGRAFFEVTDEGMGMTPEVRARAFEPFFTTKDTGRGTGLGLATVSSIVEQSGGDIGLTSEPGRGTSVVVSLPTVDEPVDAAPALLRTASSPRRGSVLVVEDDDAVRTTMRRVLEAAGYRVVDTGSAETALRIHTTHAQAFDVVVSDVWMPSMDGLDLAARLRERDPAARIVFVTGFADDRVIREASAVGAILTKPFSAQTLVDTVAQAIRPAASAQ